MSDDRYERVSKIPKSLGWLQDLILRNTRRCVVDILESSEAVSILDACCGSGTLSVYLRNSGMNVTGVDASPSMLALARGKGSDINFIEADLTNFDMAERVDAAIVAFSIHEMDEDSRGRIWNTMKRLIKPGGVLVVADFAESERRGLPSKISWWFIWNDEKNIGKHDPGHFQNYREFMQNGGITSWLNDRNEEIVDENYFQWGNIAAVSVKNRPVADETPAANQAAGDLRMV